MVRIECSDLFFIILNHADFNKDKKIVNADIKAQLKKILYVVEHIVPGKDWKERINYGDTMQDMYSTSCLCSKRTD